MGAATKLAKGTDVYIIAKSEAEAEADKKHGRMKAKGKLVARTKSTGLWACMGCLSVPIRLILSYSNGRKEEERGRRRGGKKGRQTKTSGVPKGE